MSNEEQAPRDRGQDGPAVVDPDDVVLDDGDVSVETLEPELSVSPDTLQLAEPALEPANISSDTAEAASLEDAAAEARAVAAEAEKAGTLVGGPMPSTAPVVQSAPDGTAPAGGAAGDTDQDASAETPTGSDTAADADAPTVPEPTAADAGPDSETHRGTDADADTHTGIDADADASADLEATAADAGPGGDTHQGTDTDTAAPAAAPRTTAAADIDADSEGDTARPAETDTQNEEAVLGEEETPHDGPPSVAATSAPPTEEDPVAATGKDPDGPVGGPYAFPPEGGEPGLGHPGVYPGTDPGALGPADSSAAGPSPASGTSSPGAHAWVPTAPEAGQDTDGHPKRDRTRPRNSNLPLLLIIGGAVVLLGLLMWLLVSLFGGAGGEGRVDPSSLAAGECLADFTDITEDAVLVDCTEPHNAQLLASESYPDDAEFPGRDQLGLRAEAACATASEDINPEVVVEDLDVTLLRATPTAETWADGDRRVDCFAVIGNGDTMSQSLLNP